jgi:hypothetical protein
LRISKLFVVESATVLGFAAVITQSLILSNNTMHFQQLFLNYYADKSVDFSADVTALVRSLGIVDLLTLVFGLTIGAAMALTYGSNLAKGGAKGVEQLDQFERSLMISGLVNVTKTQEGTTYQVTEMGRRFLKEFAYLQRMIEEPTVPHQET